MNFQEEALFELRFWMQILGDHSRFIHDSLAAEEVNRIAAAKAFIQLFDQLLYRSRQPLDDRQLMTLLQEARAASDQVRAFKLSLLSEHLVGSIKTSLPPTFLNHMVNETEEALRVLTPLSQGQKPPVVHPLHHDLVWLLDAVGHAGAINDRLDLTEKNLKQLSHQYAKEWEEFYLKAVELAGYLRTNITHFPALAKFHRDIELEMLMFMKFLNELEEMKLDKEVLGVLTPLMADHMAREECYYLMKLSETTKVKAPPCDPTKPRTEEAAAAKKG
ncbi:DUF2935 domain-containing protein [Paenibacillus alkalitolerans]|uniref:DUF2935 domain-containing protein n=1 Tax=Paenibacillus alkalitolerans TaxID=2799335 RepID=UPI0018F36E87|nr:DUF2935 domain-containing protein [Paenibacillus alkalitolerans]